MSTALAVLVLFLTGPDDWPQWRGPRLDGVSLESAWSAEGRADSAWTADVGLGYSSTVVGNGRVYTKGYDEAQEQDVVRCLSLDSGEVLWTYAHPARIWNEYHGGGTLSTPALDGGTLYLLNREGRAHALDADTGEVRWQVDLREGRELTIPRWGFAASPLVLDGEVVLNVGRVLALDARTGEVLRESEEDLGQAYSSPTPVERPDGRCLAVFDSNGLALLGPDLGTRAFVEWRTKNDINCASPLLVDGRVLVSSGHGKGAALYAIGDGGFEPVWATRSISTKLSGCVRIGPYLYGFDGDELVCVSLADGESAWKERGLGNGTVLATPERLIVLTGKGELIVARASGEGFEPLSRAPLFSEDDGVLWTRPTLADGRILCRSSKGKLVCRDHRASER